MEKVLKAKKIWLIAAIASASLGALSVVGIVIFALKLLYVPLGLSIAFVAHAFYGCPFYLIAFGNARLCERTVTAVSDKGVFDIDLISEDIKAKPNFTKKIVEKCINKGYLLGYTLDGDKLVGSSSN